jgi:proteasome lid subunit RPN8/RPN11
LGKAESDLLERTKHSRYTIPPLAIFQAQQRGRELQLDIIGFFHSHPDCPAIPSICDRDQAWEIYSYPIVSVIQGKVADIQSWVLDRERNFQAEEIQNLLS